VVASAREAPAQCAALVIDRNVLRRTGAVSLRRHGDGFAITAVRPDGYDRPWARARPAPAEQVATPATTRAQSPDATARPEDLEPGD
jgi:competence protein ComEC